MKFITVILAFYVMILTFMPCVDANNVNDDCYSSVHHEQSSEQSENFEICSPFCFCACCQTLTEISSFTLPMISLPGVELITASFVQNDLESYISFWRPPKV